MYLKRSFYVAVACLAGAPAANAVDIPVGTDQYTVTFDPGSITHPDLSWPDVSSGRCTFGGLFRAARNPLDPLVGPTSRTGTFVARFTPATGRRFTTGSISHGGGLNTAPYTIVEGSVVYRLMPIAGGATLTEAFPSISVCGENYNLVWLPGQYVYGNPQCSGPAALSLRGPVALPPGGFDCEIDMSVSVAGQGFINIGALAFELATEPLPLPPPCPVCAADYDENGGVDGGDLAAFFVDFEAGETCADVDVNGGVDGGDLAAFFQVFESGGC